MFPISLADEKFVCPLPLIPIGIHINNRCRSISRFPPFFSAAPSLPVNIEGENDVIALRRHSRCRYGDKGKH